jgi:hypothetical protein
MRKQPPLFPVQPLISELNSIVKEFSSPYIAARPPSPAVAIDYDKTTL